MLRWWTAMFETKYQLVTIKRWILTIFRMLSDFYQNEHATDNNNQNKVVRLPVRLTRVTRILKGVRQC